MKIFFQNGFIISLAVAILGFAFLFWRQRKTEKQLAIIFKEGENSEREPELQREVIRRLMKLEVMAEELRPRLELVEKISRISVQKIGFLRFNPFYNTGGDNSFIVALLDRDNSGVLLSSLYTREGVRLYGKNIEKGEPKQPLSDEEKKVLADAIKKAI